MLKTILLTGATDGIGLETVKSLAPKGHTLLIHGRSDQKLVQTQAMLEAIDGVGKVEAYCADLAKLAEVKTLAASIANTHKKLDVLINNAGVFKAQTSRTETGHDERFVVNTIAPYLLTRLLLPIIPKSGRILNLSSAAQASVEMDAFRGERQLEDNAAYAQSKLALTMWSFHLAGQMGENGPAVIAINPASFLNSKMVKNAYGTAGKDLSIGADILVRAALSDEFANVTGAYFDNDRGQFLKPHLDALDIYKNTALVHSIEEILGSLER